MYVILWFVNYTERNNTTIEITLSDLGSDGRDSGPTYGERQISVTSRSRSGTVTTITRVRVRCLVIE